MPAPDEDKQASVFSSDDLTRAIAAALSGNDAAETDVDYQVGSDADFVPLPEVLATKRPASLSGWLVGIVVGVLAGLWMLPPVRYTLGSQLRFALAQDSLPWLRSLDTQHSLREAPRLDAAAATLPEDYLLQVGRATAFVEAGGVRPLPAITVGHADDVVDRTDHTLVRLTQVAHDFPINPGAQAHLARYMMVDRVRIQRRELGVQGERKPQKEKAQTTSPKPQAATDSNQQESSASSTINRASTSSPEGHQPPTVDPPPATIPARYSDVKLMTWALRTGERVDPDNAFWPAMLATTYFAAGRDRQALAALARCDHKTHWDSYLYEEVLGQWRLYSLAYGDHGAAQKIGPLTMIAFPHLRELRHTAEMARWHADRAVERGDIEEAIRIRRHILLLGHTLRETATWAYEALYGTDLQLIVASDSDAVPQQTAIRAVSQWEPRAQRYLALLRAMGKKSEITVLYAEVEECSKLRERVDLARADASYPGIPPGIPLIALFGDWMTGVCLLQQLLVLCLCVILARVWQGWTRLGTRLPRLLSVWALLGITTACGTLLFSSLPSSRLAVLFFAGACILLVLSVDALQERWWRRSRERQDNPAFSPLSPLNSAGSDGTLFAWQQTRVEARWSGGTTLRMVLGLFTPGLLTLWLLHPLLSSLHPVALLLTSLMGGDASVSGIRALQMALLACAAPLALVIGLCLWALWRRVPVLAGVVTGVRRVFLPSVTCIAIVYLALLHQTLQLDTEATHAINEAARDDRNWVLTHSEEK